MSLGGEYRSTIITWPRHTVRIIEGERRRRLRIIYAQHQESVFAEGWEVGPFRLAVADDQLIIDDGVALQQRWHRRGSGQEREKRIAEQSHGHLALSVVYGQEVGEFVFLTHINPAVSHRLSLKIKKRLPFLKQRYVERRRLQAAGVGAMTGATVIIDRSKNQYLAAGDRHHKRRRQRIGHRS